MLVKVLVGSLLFQVMCFAAEVRPTVLVTGANRGLGLEYATRFAARGYHVIGTARDPEDAAELKSVGADVFKLDVTSDEDIANLAQALEGQVIDILLNNAGMRTTKTRREDMMISFSVNTVGPLLISEALLPNLMLSKNPRIINVSSGVGILTGGTGKSGAYAVSKTAVNMVTRNLHSRLSGRGFIVISLDPGHNQTEMGGKRAKLTPEESVPMIISLIEGLEPEQSGGFWSYDGSSLPW